jgi:hypothetical protein
MTALDLREVDPGRRAAVAVDQIVSERQRHQREHRRSAALTAREALAALQFEALLVWSAAHSLANGIDLTDGDRARLTTAMQWISTICDEVAV